MIRFAADPFGDMIRFASWFVRKIIHFVADPFGDMIRFVT